MKYWSVPRMWEGETVACIATGPSMSIEVALQLRGIRTITINDAYLHAPWADLHWFCDIRWWNWHKEGTHPSQKILGEHHFKNREGTWVALESASDALNDDPSIKIIRNDTSAKKGGRSKPTGFCSEPDGVRTGRNSGFQVMNLAAHTGVKRILLVGYDMRMVGGKAHWFGNHPGQTNSRVYMTTFIPFFKSLVAPLAGLGIEVINCTPGSELNTFPKMDLKEALNANGL